MKEELSHKPGFDSEGHLDENSIAQAAEHLKGWSGEPDPAVMLHLADCQQCRIAVMETADLLDETSEMELHEDPAPYHTISRPATQEKPKPALVMTPLWRTVIGIAGVVFLAWFIQHYFRNDDRKTPSDHPAEVIEEKQPQRMKPDSTVNTVDSTDVIQDTNTMMLPEPPPEPARLPDTIRFAEAFVPSQLYENLVKARYRDVDSVWVRGPAPETILSPGDTLSITWSHDPVEDFSVALVNNAEKEIQRFAPTAEGELQWVLKLEPGLYYWKLEGSEDLKGVGRFRVMSKQ